jgi:hypothetical protein
VRRRLLAVLAFGALLIAGFTVARASTNDRSPTGTPGCDTTTTATTATSGGTTTDTSSTSTDTSSATTDTTPTTTDTTPTTTDTTPTTADTTPTTTDTTPTTTDTTPTTTDTTPTTGSNLAIRAVAASPCPETTTTTATAPVITTPDDITVEANGPNGSSVSYPPATATGNYPVACTPPSGSLFPIGTTTVTCSVKDGQGNLLAQASFTVTVRDTTPPELTVPCNLAIQAASAVPATDPAIASFLSGATAEDIVDPAPTITTNAPGSFAVGTTTVTFTAEDTYGNQTAKNATVTVGPDVAAGTCEADRLPPGNVRDVTARTGNLSVSITWQPPADKDFDHVEITRSVQQSRAAQGTSNPKLVYKGTDTKFVDKGLTDSVQYRYVIVSVDKAGNRSAGVAVIALAQRQALLSPGDNSTVKKPPLIKWLKVKGAGYYNLQLWRSGVKVLSAWPKKNSYKLKAQWRFNRKTQRLTNGEYAVYVWPGFGKPAAGNYGKLLVQATFVVRR